MYASRSAIVFAGLRLGRAATLVDHHEPQLAAADHERDRRGVSLCLLRFLPLTTNSVFFEREDRVGLAVEVDREAVRHERIGQHDVVVGRPSRST